MNKRRDKNTLDIFDWQPPKVEIGYEPEVAGRGHLDNKIARLISRALQDAKHNQNISRFEIAGKMTIYLDRKVSEEIINKWASEASDNRIPLDAFIALIDVTDAQELLGFVPEIFGHLVVPEKYSSVIDLYLIEKHEEEVAARKAQISLKLRGLK